MAPDHQPFYCEENIYRLVASGRVAHPSEVVLVTNARRQVACWHQRAGALGEPILWDYHVVLLEHRPGGALIWDLDTRLPCPIAAIEWVAATFHDPALVRAPFHPRFRVVPAAVFLAEFATDRSHMRTAAGRYQRPPPPWEPPGGGAMNLSWWLDLGSDAPGQVLGRAGFLSHLDAVDALGR